ncbi:hypothetical protein MRX96_003866 [Rhipicephalus microplus]
MDALPSFLYAPIASIGGGGAAAARRARARDRVKVRALGAGQHLSAGPLSQPGQYYTTRSIISNATDPADRRETTAPRHRATTVYRFETRAPARLHVRLRGADDADRRQTNGRPYWVNTVSQQAVRAFRLHGDRCNSLLCVGACVYRAPDAAGMLPNKKAANGTSSQLDSRGTRRGCLFAPLSR